MGFCFTIVAVRGGNRDTAMATIGLRGTDDFEEFPESDLTGVTLPSGWYVVTAQRFCFPVATDAILRQLSQSAEVLACSVYDVVMCSEAKSWFEGRIVWQVAHSGEVSTEHLWTKGILPPVFHPIRDRLRAEQTSAGGKKAKVDFTYDLPVELVAAITGYHPCKEARDLGDRPFEVLVPIPPPPKQSLWKRLLGG